MRQAVTENKIVKSKKAKNSFILAAAGIAGGLFLTVTGLILWIISYFERISYRGLDTALIVTGFMFLAIGSHFLDLMDEEKKT